MKDMNFPIDIIWISDGTIVGYAKGVYVHHYGHKSFGNEPGLNTRELWGKNFVKYLPQAHKEGGLGFAVITDNTFYALPMPDYNLNSEKQLHKDQAPAVIWPSQEKEYFLNGVKCPETIVLPKPEDLPAKFLLKEQNAEVRREIVRKIGIERICKDLGAECIDKKGDYELLMLDLQDGRARPYLKMKNPSIGVYHIEGVEPKIRTVNEALAWRNGLEKYVEPESLS